MACSLHPITGLEKCSFFLKNTVSCLYLTHTEMFTENTFRSLWLVEGSRPCYKWQRTTQDLWVIVDHPQFPLLRNLGFSIITHCPSCSFYYILVMYCVLQYLCLPCAKLILSFFFFRVMTNKLILIVMIVVLLGILGGLVYWKFFSWSKADILVITLIHAHIDHTMVPVTNALYTSFSTWYNQFADTGDEAYDVPNKCVIVISNSSTPRIRLGYGHE